MNFLGGTRRISSGRNDSRAIFEEVERHNLSVRVVGLAEFSSDECGPIGPSGVGWKVEQGFLVREIMTRSECRPRRGWRRNWQ